MEKSTMDDPRYVYRPLLDLIGLAEGTDKGDAYNETLAYGAYSNGDVNLVSMTLDEVDRLQTRKLSHPANKWNSSAVGRYQIVRTTLRKIRNKLKLSGKALFDEAMQDRMACFLLGGRGIDRYLAGTLSENAMINALAKEWASFPTTSGYGHYSNQKRTPITVQQVRDTLAEVRERYEQGDTGKIIEKDPEPIGRVEGKWAGNLGLIERMAEEYTVDELEKIIGMAQVAKFLKTIDEQATVAGPTLQARNSTITPSNPETGVMTMAKPFWQSRTFWGIALVAVSQFSPAAGMLLEAVGITPALEPGTAGQVTEGIEQLTTAVGTVLTLFGRIFANAPLKLK